MTIRLAKFAIGQVVRHRILPIRGVVVDVDPEFGHGDAWWNALPAEDRPARHRPFYHVIAEGLDHDRAAYVSEQHLVADASGEPIRHRDAGLQFAGFQDGRYRVRSNSFN
ncbi:MAG: heat shock protein HspQ [Caulobacterales bacterium]|nr:heat shock protein HspQ [Caulobacterales bacterium]